MASQDSQSLDSLLQYVQSKLIVKQLTTILKTIGLPSSGIKKALQDRLVDRIREVYALGDTEQIKKLRMLIYDPNLQLSTTPISSGYPHSSSFGNGTTASPTASSPGGYYNPAQRFGATSAVNRVHFKPSPFYVILESLTAPQQCPIMSNHRNTVSTSIHLTEKQCSMLANKQAKAMLYCGALEAPSELVKMDVAFPQQVEVKVNAQQVPGSQLRGLKNKPGSTRPADITDLMEKHPGLKNDIALTYACTAKYVFVVNLVNHVEVDTLVEQLRLSDSRISKQTVINDMIKRNEDSDLVATSSVMSLKCPLSTLRIELPVRSKICTHVQCFDARSFLQLQQQAPTWQCPTCNKSVPFDMLVVDSYVQDILESTPKSTESVIVDSHGNWSMAEHKSESPDTPTSDLDDDIIEIHDTPKKRDNLKLQTPSQTVSREESAARSTGKRTIAQVIDLTLSDDEDDQPPRPKRSNTGQLQSLPTSPFDRPGRLPITIPLGNGPAAAYAQSPSMSHDTGLNHFSG